MTDILTKYKKHLTNKQYKILSLYLIDGYNKQEIADSMAVSKQYINKVWQSIRERVSRSGLLDGTGRENEQR